MLRLAVFVGILSAVIGIVAVQAGLLGSTAPATVLTDQNAKTETTRLSGSSVSWQEAEEGGVGDGSSSDERSAEEPAIHPSGDERQADGESSSDTEAERDREEPETGDAREEEGRSDIDGREQDSAFEEESGECEGDACDGSSGEENGDAFPSMQDEVPSDAADESRTEEEREPPSSCGNGRCESFGCNDQSCFFDFETCGICPEDCGACPAGSSSSSSSAFDACTSCDDCRGREGIGCNPQECFQWGTPGTCLFNWAGRVVDGITVSCIPVAACSAASSAGSRSVSTSSASASRSFSARSQSASRSRASSAAPSVSSRSSAASSPGNVFEQEAASESSSRSASETVRDCSACHRCNGAESCTAAACMRNSACFFILSPDGRGECSPGASCVQEPQADVHPAPPAASDDQQDFCCPRDSNACTPFAGACDGTVFYSSKWTSDQCSSVCSALTVHLYLCMGSGTCRETTSLDNIRAGQVVFGDRGKCNQFCLTTAK